MLRESPLVTGIKTYHTDQKAPSAVTGIDWIWAEDQQNGGSAVFGRNADRSVAYISTGFRGGLYLKDVIAAYGEPSHVMAVELHPVDRPTVDEYRLELLWVEQGFALGWEYSKVGVLPEISPEAGPFYPFFFVPSLEGYYALYGGHPLPPGTLAPWRGMQSFLDYCVECMATP